MYQLIIQKYKILLSYFQFGIRGKIKSFIQKPQPSYQPPQFGPSHFRLLKKKNSNKNLQTRSSPKANHNQQTIQSNQTLSLLPRNIPHTPTIKLVPSQINIQPYSQIHKFNYHSLSPQSRPINLYQVSKPQIILSNIYTNTKPSPNHCFDRLPKTIQMP